MIYCVEKNERKGRMKVEAMDMQQLTFFTEGNTFTGSRTKDWTTKAMLRYLVKPDKETGKLLAYCWTEDVCFEKSSEQERQAADFPLTDEGIEQVKDWLLAQYERI